MLKDVRFWMGRAVIATWAGAELLLVMVVDRRLKRRSVMDSLLVVLTWLGLGRGRGMQQNVDSPWPRGRWARWRSVCGAWWAPGAGLWFGRMHIDDGLSTREKYPPLRGGGRGFCERGCGVTLAAVRGKLTSMRSRDCRVVFGEGNYGWWS